MAANDMTLETKPCKGGWYNVLRARNGRILMHSEVYASRWNAIRAAKMLATIWPGLRGK